jgi:hypothetical protein
LVISCIIHFLTFADAFNKWGSYNGYDENVIQQITNEVNSEDLEQMRLQLDEVVTDGTVVENTGPKMDVATHQMEPVRKSKDRVVFQGPVAYHQGPCEFEFHSGLKNDEMSGPLEVGKV